MIYLMASSTTCGCSSARQFLVLLLTQARFRLTLQSKKDAKTSFVICWDFAHVGSEYRLGVFQHIALLQDASESIADFVDFVLRCFAEVSLTATFGVLPLPGVQRCRHIRTSRMKRA